MQALQITAHQRDGQHYYGEAKEGIRDPKVGRQKRGHFEAQHQYQNSKTSR
jgi:hypothetical protein